MEAELYRKKMINQLRVEGKVNGTTARVFYYYYYLFGNCKECGIIINL